MNQQLIFNDDYHFDAIHQAVSCSVLQAGLRLQVLILMPEGWQKEAWLYQVKEDCFFWEEQIEAAVAAELFGEDGIVRLDGSL
ncbi:hypothetical protein [Rheinheimera sp.]|uniref:hypothetical protein n=1 Tax=Rheinheimera sp. TaxID=1869214 RepID=UPI0027BA343D|nr:hypothetical protein [Rheinheimera sp.]